MIRNWSMGLYKNFQMNVQFFLFSILDIEMAFKKIVKRLSESPFCLNRTFTELSVTLFFLEHTSRERFRNL
jgi:hypothetical protein